MNKVLVGVVLVGFAALNVEVMAMSGIAGLERLIQEANPWALLFVTDLVIALGIIGFALFKDAKKRGVSAVPYLLLTAFTGSIGPLLYLMRRREA